MPRCPARCPDVRQDAQMPNEMPKQTRCPDAQRDAQMPNEMPRQTRCPDVIGFDNFPSKQVFKKLKIYLK